MVELESVERLFQMPAEELVSIPHSEWNETFSDIHGGDLQLFANKLIELSVKAARMSAYVEARAKGKEHATAVSEQNACAEKVRAALDFQNPKADINF